MKKFLILALVGFAFTSCNGGNEPQIKNGDEPFYDSLEIKQDSVIDVQDTLVFNNYNAFNDDIILLEGNNTVVSSLPVFKQIPFEENYSSPSINDKEERWRIKTQQRA